MPWMWLGAGFFLIWDHPPGGGGECLGTAGTPPPGGLEKAHMPGAAGKFLVRFDTTPLENAICACPRQDPPPRGGVPKSLGAWAPPGPPSPRGS
jgi:hypothetical protein